jgi:CheY-like chemotaxis protein
MHTAPNSSGGESSATGRRRILLVEDDDETRVALRALLEDEGFEVEVAEDGSEGVRLARSKVPDAIVMDLVLPVLNGLDAAVELRREERTAEIPLIAMTASWLGSAVERLRAVGFNGALRKPFSPRDLLDELARHQVV